MSAERTAGTAGREADGLGKYGVRPGTATPAPGGVPQNEEDSRSAGTPHLVLPATGYFGAEAGPCGTAGCEVKLMVLSTTRLSTFFHSDPTRFNTVD
jgi:hypothetical protein